MKLTKQYLTKVIREEINKTVKEYAGDTAALEMSGGKEGFDLTPGGRQRTDSKKMSADTGAAEKALDKQAQLKRLLSKVDRRGNLHRFLGGWISYEQRLGGCVPCLHRTSGCSRYCC